MALYSYYKRSFKFNNSIGIVYLKKKTSTAFNRLLTLIIATYNTSKGKHEK